MLSQRFDVIMGWGVTFQSQGNERDPQNQQNLVLSYQIAILAQDAKGQWRYGEDIYHPNTSQAERLTLGQLLWFGLQCVQIGYRSAQGLRILLVAHNTTATWSCLADRETCFRPTGTTIAASVVTMWPQYYRLRDQHGHGMAVKVSLQDIWLLAPDSGHGLVIADYAQSIGLPIEDCPSVMYEPCVALAYYVHFMNQYHQAFGVATVPKTLGEASAKAFVTSLGGAKSAAYYRLFGFEDYEVQWGNRKRMRKGNVSARRTSAALAADSFHGGMNLTYVFEQRQCTSDELILDLDFKGAYSTALACIPAIDWQQLASVNAQRDQFFPKRIEEIVDRHQDLEKLEYVPPIMGSIAFAFPSACRHPSLPVSYTTGKFYPLRGSTCATGIEMVQAQAMGAEIDLLTVQAFPIQHDPGTGKPFLVFVEYIRKVNQLRAEYDTGTLPNMLFKEMANSLYGKSGQGIEEKRRTNFFDVDTAGKPTKKPLPPSEITCPHYAALCTGIVRTALAAVVAGLDAPFAPG